MKIHDLLVTEISNSLDLIFFEDKQYADKVVEKALKRNKKWGSRDRKFFAESIFEVTRWWRLLNYLHEGKDTSSEEVTDLKSLWALWWYWQKNELLLEYTTLDKALIDQRIKLLNDPITKTQIPLAVRESIPNWLDKLGCMELGEVEWSLLLPALNEKASVYLRVNLLKTSAKDLQSRLKSEDDIETELITNECLKLHERKNVFITKSFLGGLFEVQDLSSQEVASFLDVQPGQRVIDACAGAGGKSLHLAVHMKNKGRIIALDIHEWKLNELKSRARRDGIDIIETRVIENSKTIKRLEESCDRLLLDVPCSGSGVIRRNPDTKWKLNSEEFERQKQLQFGLLRDYSKMLKPGGKMVYSTCSVFPSENEQQVEAFLKSDVGQKFTLIEQKRLQPNTSPGDGFYMAVFLKRNNCS